MTRGEHLLCFGMGFSARRLAEHLVPEGWGVTGTATSADGVARIAAKGYAGLLFDGTAPGAHVAAALATATHVVVSVPPDDAGDPVLRHHGSDLAAAASVRWIGYLSTVGVYGDRKGAWVDETSPPTPVNDRSRRRLLAEDAWLSFGRESGKRVQIFRLAGIYGPGRSAIDNLRAGRAQRVVKPGQKFNRIHVDDIAGVLIAAMRSDSRHTIFNVTDDEPAAPQDVVAYAAHLLGREPPPEVKLEEAELSAMAQSFFNESKLVSNARIKEALGVTLAYPTYREGLAAIAAS
ncbi:MAG: SDR family oxidoreductase [Pseudomonadota bacterium]